MIYFTAEDMTVFLPKKCMSQQQKYSQLCLRLLNECFHTFFLIVVFSLTFPWNFLVFSSEENKNKKHPCKHWRRRQEGAAETPQHPMGTVSLEQMSTLLSVKTITLGRYPWEGPQTREFCMFLMLPGTNRQSFPNNTEIGKIKTPIF